MPLWAIIFFEAKRIVFSHYPWRTTMSSVGGETQAVPAFMVVSECIGPSQQVHGALSPEYAEKAKQRNQKNKTERNNTEVVNKLEGRHS